LIISGSLMKTNLRAAVAVLTAFAISSSGLFGLAAPAIAQMQTGGDTATTPDMSMGMGGGGGNSDMMMSMMHEMMANHKWGMISSINNDGQAEWIISGDWMMETGSQNDTATSNATGMISNVAGFDAILHMVMLDGSAMHNHEISNFTQMGDATFDSATNTTTITGTITITMREGPVPNVPTTIQIAQDQVIAISPDPAALENHFGTEPIYGIVVTPEMIEQMMMRYGDKMGTMNMTGMDGMSGMMEEGPMDGTMMTNSSGGM
jgi:hypothetical protein